MIDEILSRLEKVKDNGRGRYRACCPAHGSTGRTLSLLFKNDGRVLVHCHAGCEAVEVMQAIGLSLSDLYPDGSIKEFIQYAKPIFINEAPQSQYSVWLDMFERQKGKLKTGERFTQNSLTLAREMYLKSRQA